MCEVTVDNFAVVFENIRNSFNKAKFIAIDTEFSALNSSEKNSNSLFDTPAKRYEKLRLHCEQIVPMQVGLSAFFFDPEENSYMADTYTFYVFPKKFHNINPIFLFQSSSLEFLCTYSFDFNKFVYKGVPYINRSQENEVKNFQKHFSMSNLNTDNTLDGLIEEAGTKVSEWINDKTDRLILQGIIHKHRYSLDSLYFLHKYLRKCFNKRIWTIEENGEFVVKKVSCIEFNKLEEESKDDEILLNNMLGFTQVFRLLINLKKPIIGHNLFLDLLIIYHKFENPLPKFYKTYKKKIHELFPVIYDTKCITFDLKKDIPENKMWERNTLEMLYDYFRNGYGRHLALNSPLIQLKDQPTHDQFHNAGWDSYCTGYIFIRMAHIYASNKFTKKSKFMSSELCASLNHTKNWINLIRCSVSHIQLDDDDPISRRPPCLIIESTNNKALNISKITCLLSSYGFVEIKPYSRSGRRAIVAVDNYGSVKRIMRQYRTHDEFQIKQYSLIRHSPTARAAMWGGVLASGIILAWLARSALKK